MWQLLKILNVFNTLILKQIFWKTKISLKKLEELFLDENTKIENATFLRKTSPSEDNMKANWMGSTKWNYHKERSFPSNYFIFLNFFSVWNPLIKILFDVQTTQMSISILFVTAGVLFEVKVFNNGPRKICGRQFLKNLKSYGLLRGTISVQIF